MKPPTSGIGFATTLLPDAQPEVLMTMQPIPSLSSSPFAGGINHYRTKGASGLATLAQLASSQASSPQSFSPNPASLKRGMQAQGSLSRLDTASTVLEQVSYTLTDISALATRAADSSLNADDRAALNADAQQLLQGLQQSVSGSSFNGTPLLQGDAHTTYVDGPVTYQDPNGNEVLAPLAGLDLSSTASATSAQSQISDAFSALGEQQAQLGASYGRLERAQELALQAPQPDTGSDLLEQASAWLENAAETQIAAKLAQVHLLQQKNAVATLLNRKD